MSQSGFCMGTSSQRFPEDKSILRVLSLTFGPTTKARAVSKSQSGILQSLLKLCSLKDFVVK